jgi:hypothetical protein
VNLKIFLFKFFYLQPRESSIYYFLALSNTHQSLIKLGHTLKLKFLRSIVVFFVIFYPLINMEAYYSNLQLLKNFLQEIRKPLQRNMAETANMLTTFVKVFKLYAH